MLGSIFGGNFTKITCVAERMMRASAVAILSHSSSGVKP